MKNHALYRKFMLKESSASFGLEPDSNLPEDLLRVVPLIGSDGVSLLGEASLHDLQITSDRMEVYDSFTYDELLLATGQGGDCGTSPQCTEIAC